MTPDDIYDVLVEECGANERLRPDFVHYLSDETVGHHEFRFQGALGFGGKLYRNGNGVYVSCYREDDTPKRMQMIAAANRRLRDVS